MSLDCSITDIIRSDFNTLWSCSHRGHTVEVVTPYLMPDSTFFTLFFTQREDRIIACDGGRIWELISENLKAPTADVLEELRALARTHGLKEGDNQGEPIFFKDCRETKLISSIAFDVAHFATVATHVILSAVREETEEVSTRFVTAARNYLGQILPPDLIHPNAPVPGVPNVKFSAVISKDSKLWIVSCISGNTLTDFRKNMSDAAFNLKDARLSRAQRMIEKTVPLLNNNAPGYDPDKLGLRLDELAEFAQVQPVLWTEKQRLIELLPAA